MDIFIARRVANMAAAGQKAAAGQEKSDNKEAFNRREQKAFWKESEKSALRMEISGERIQGSNSDGGEGIEGEQEDGGDGDIAGVEGAEEGFMPQAKQQELIPEDKYE